jgi:hypothetical protein
VNSGHPTLPIESVLSSFVLIKTQARDRYLDMFEAQ